MDAGAIVSCLLCLISAIAITPLVLLLNSFLVSILPVKRNLFTYLDQFFIRVALFDVYAGVCARANILKFSFYIWSEFCGDCEAALGSHISDLGLNLLRHDHLVFVLHWRDPPSCQPSAGLSCCDGKVPTNDICSFVQVYLQHLNFMTNSLVFQPVTFNNLKHERAAMTMVSGLLIFNTLLHVTRGYFCHDHNDWCILTCGEQ